MRAVVEARSFLAPKMRFTRTLKSMAEAFLTWKGDWWLVGWWLVGWWLVGWLVGGWLAVG